AFKSGLVLLPGAVVMGLMNPITGYLFDVFGGKWLARVGLLVLTVTTFAFTNLSEDTSFAYLATMNAFRMLSIAMVMMPMTTLALNQLPNSLIPHGTAMNNTFRQVSGSVGTAVLVTIMATAAIPGEKVAGLIHGVNVSFIVAGAAAFIGVLLSFKLKENSKSTSSTKMQYKNKAPPRKHQELFPRRCFCLNEIFRHHVEISFGVNR